MASSRLRIPYPTVVTFERALGLLSALGPGDYVDRDLLLAHGFAANAVTPLLESFRFLRLTDNAGNVLVSVASFRESPQPLVERALVPVLQRLSPPYPSRKALALALAPALDMTATTVPLAATFVIWLSARAGRELIDREGGKPGARAGVARPTLPAPARRAVPALPGPAGRRDGPQTAITAPTPGDSRAPAVTFQLMVDRKTTREDLDRMVREVKEARSRLER